MEESIKHIYELNSVVRMSLIEMQFIKKVRSLNVQFINILADRLKLKHSLASSFNRNC